MIVKRGAQTLALGAPPRVSVASGGAITLSAGGIDVVIDRSDLSVLKPCFLAYCDEIDKALALARLSQPS